METFGIINEPETKNKRKNVPGLSLGLTINAPNPKGGTTAQVWRTAQA